MKVMSIFGTRPEIIRLSSVFKELEKKGFDHTMVNTCQNYTYSLNRVFFNQLGIRRPDYELRIATSSFGTEIASIIRKTEEILLKERPEIVLILGDTNSGLSAIPAAYHGVRIAHMEAGMRSYDWRMPEEKNRVTIDHLSSVLFPYTEYSRQNLLRENIAPNKIYVIGNPIVDVIQSFNKDIEKCDILNEMNLEKGKYFLVTAHRTENVDDKKSLSNILRGLELIYKKYGFRVIYPMHPRTRSKIGKLKIPKGVEAINPLGFIEFAKLEKECLCLITDSGTVQEEGCYFRVPCVTIRKTTERPETVEIGSNIIAGLDPENILASVGAAIKTVPDWEYSLGDGRSSVRVVNVLRGVF